jgi:membrane associated rhomboid family serine protease
MIPIRDTAPCYSKPYVTWTIIVICSSIFVAMNLMPDQMAIDLLNRFGMVPARYSGLYDKLPFDGYLSFVTNLFLHSSWIHLLLNIWFLFFLLLVDVFGCFFIYSFDDPLFCAISLCEFQK